MEMRSFPFGVSATVPFIQPILELATSVLGRDGMNGIFRYSSHVDWHE